MIGRTGGADVAGSSARRSRDGRLPLRISRQPLTGVGERLGGLEPGDEARGGDARDRSIVLWDGRGIANDGLHYENSYAWLAKLHERKVIDGTAFYDSISFNEALDPSRTPELTRSVLLSRPRPPGRPGAPRPAPLSGYELRRERCPSSHCS